MNASALWLLIAMTASGGGGDHARATHRFEDADKWAAIWDHPSRDAWQEPAQVLELMDLSPGMTVADIGAGTGYFNPYLSEAVGPEGRVLAVDIEPGLVDHMRERAEAEGTANVVPVLATPEDPKLPAGEVDRILLVDTYHHIDERIAYFGRLLGALAEGGRLVNVDWKPGDLELGPSDDHKMAPIEVVDELTAAGWVQLREAELTYQYVQVFAPAPRAGAIQRIRDLEAEGDYETALEEARIGLAARRERFGPEALPLAEMLDRVAYILVSLGRTGEEEAMAAADRSLALREAHLGPEHLETADSHQVRGTILRGRGELPAARAALEEAYRIRSLHLEAPHEGLARVMSSIAILYAMEANYDEALVRFRDSLSMLEAVLGPEDPELAGFHTNLGTLHRILGDYRDARASLERALEVQLANDPDHPDVAVTYNAMADLSYNLDDLRGAQEQYEESLRRTVEAFGADHPRAGHTTNGLGLVAMRLGDYRGARDHFRSSLANLEAAQGESHPTFPYVCTNLGLSEYFLGRYDEARVALRRASEIREANLGRDHPDFHLTAVYQGFVDLAAGDPAAAAPRLRAAAARFSEEYGADHHRVVEALYKLAAAEAALGDLDAAWSTIQRAMEAAATHEVETLTTIAARDVRARLALRRGDPGQARRDALENEAITRAQSRVVLQTLSEGAGLRFSRIRISGLDTAITSALDTSEPEVVAEVWDAVARSRGLLLEEMIERRRILRQRATPELASLADAVVVARTRLADLVVRGEGGDDFADRVAEASQDKEAAEAALARASASFRERREQGRVGLDQVLAALPSGAALVAYRQFERLDADGAGHPHLVALVAASGAVHLVDLGDADAVSEDVAAWRRQLEAGFVPDGPLATAALRAYRAAGERLRARIWDPVTPWIGDADPVFVVPDGDLHLVSFPSLPVGDGFLVERDQRVHVLAAERDLVRPIAASGASEGTLLAVGDPLYDDRSGVVPADHRGSRALDCVGLGEFAPLPGTGVEVEAVSTLWGRERTLQLVAGDATEERVAAAMGSARAMHLATHGYFLGEACHEAGAGSVYQQDPLLLSGLALAGANLRGEVEPGTPDGILTAEEIAGMDLPRLEWVVLSACDTATGDVLRGEGVLGLRRAFEAAGVDALVMSLWPVDDEHTARWMEAFYRARFREGQPVASSMATAARTVLASRREAGLSPHPAWWGAFVATGDWR